MRALVGFALLATACAGPSSAYKLDLNGHLARREWDQAAADIEAARQDAYGKDEVLYLLDKAAVLHAAGRHAESDALLDQAEQRMDELYTKSLSQAAGRFFVNDTTTEYAGEPYERALLHVLRALNHLGLGSREGALVEARKVTAFLQHLSDTYQVQGIYRDDPFAQYLAALLFEDEGRLDDARICMERAREGYGTLAAELGFPPPPLELERPEGHGEIVLLHSNGTAPRKESSTFQVAWNEAVALVSASQGGEDAKVRNALVAGVAGNAITVAFPVFVDDPFVIRDADVWVADAGARARTVLVADVRALARRSFEQSLPEVQGRALARAILKYVATRVAETAAQEAGGRGLAALTGLAGRVFSAATEEADTRWWATVPAELRLARLSVPAGVHDVDVHYLDANGNAVSSERIAAVEVQPGARTYLHVRTAW